MDQIIAPLIANGPMGVVCVVLLFVCRQLFTDGKEKDQALLAEKDKRITDATTYANSLSNAIDKSDEQVKLFQAALVGNK